MPAPQLLVLPEMELEKVEEQDLLLEVEGEQDMEVMEVVMEVVLHLVVVHTIQ